MKILVTGGAGYIGSHLVRYLLKDGHSVMVLDDYRWLPGEKEKQSAREQFLSREILKKDGNAVLQFERLSLDDDIHLLDAMNRFKPELVIHLAATISVNESIQNPTDCYNNNLVNTKRLLSSMQQTGVNRIIFSSTAGVYDESDKAVTERSKLLPKNPYAESKRDAESALEECSRLGMQVKVFRYFNVGGCLPDIGKVYARDDVMSQICAASISGSTFKVNGNDYATTDGSCVRDFIHVEDIVDAHIMALEDKEPYVIYNLGTGKGTSVLELIDQFQDIAPLKWDITERRVGDIPYSVASSGKFHNIYGWAPRKTTFEMLSECYEWTDSFLGNNAD